MIERIVLLFVLLTGASQISAKSLSKNTVPCSTNLSQEKYQECILKESGKLLPNLGNGFEPLHIPPIDPYYVPQISVNKTTSAFNIIGTFTDVQVLGGKSCKIKKIRMDPEKLTVYTQLYFPLIDITGKFDLKGNVLLTSLTGYGQFAGNFTSITSDVAASGRHVIDKNGVKRVAIKKVKIINRVGDAHIEIQPGSEEYVLAASIFSNLFNTNPRPLLDLFSPTIDEITIALIKKNIRNILKTLSKDQLFPA